jgi:hypothetical protein
LQIYILLKQFQGRRLIEAHFQAQPRVKDPSGRNILHFFLHKLHGDFTRFQKIIFTPKRREIRNNIKKS